MNGYKRWKMIFINKYSYHQCFLIIYYITVYGNIFWMFIPQLYQLILPLPLKKCDIHMKDVEASYE